MINAKPLSSRPTLPKRAIVTSGMPYGNKGLHFGHIAGVFVPADFLARFLRDRIGSENVIFVSGTDSYGSPIVEGYRKEVEDGFDGTINDYVNRNHEDQAKTLDAYSISLNRFDGSSIEPSKSVHAQLSQDIMKRLYEKGEVQMRSTKQFYDAEAEAFLNGRQVIGRCPVQGCKSEKAYADECDLGHQFEPEDLIKPISQLSGTEPEMVEVSNWYLDLPAHKEDIQEYVTHLEKYPGTRPVVTQTISEFLVPPVIYVKTELMEDYEAIKDQLPKHKFTPAEKGKHSFELEFSDFEERDAAREALGAAGIFYRTGKSLLPFRLTGNVEWGVPVPDLPESEDELTFWVWPESLWAPISFSSTVLKEDNVNAFSEHDIVQWWSSDDAQIYQFIGQDNLYFYGVAQPALWEALDWDLNQSHLIANHHILFLNKKASSSGKVKPPMADDLLDYYTAEQLRTHWLALGLGMRSVSFQPKPFNPDAPEKAPDPVLKESALLTNIFNRVARSFFYTAAKFTDSKIPAGPASDDAIQAARNVILEYEKLAMKFEFHAVVQLMDDYLRDVNKRWSESSKAARNANDDEAMVQALRNLGLGLKVGTALMHPIVPKGTEAIADALKIGPALFSWENLLTEDGHVITLDELVEKIGATPGEHSIAVLPPRTDFFERHPSQE